MKLAIPWSANEKNQFGDEYNIVFDQTQNKLDNLFDFLSEHKDIRFNILIKNMTKQQMLVADTVNPNVYFRLYKSENLDLFSFFKENGLRFFFDYPAAASCFNQLEEQILFGVSDVYIADDLCYNLEKTKTMCDKHDVRIRLVLNRLPSHRYDKGINPKTPYFIPETIDELSKYIDVGEFDSSSWVKINTYYKIWFQRQEWREDLRFIYKDLELDIPNQSLIPNFLYFKMNCGYKCGYGSPCNKCEQFVEIAKSLANKNIEYVTEKEGDFNV